MQFFINKNRNPKLGREKEREFQNNTLNICKIYALGTHNFAANTKLQLIFIVNKSIKF